MGANQSNRKVIGRLGRPTNSRRLPKSLHERGRRRALHVALGGVQSEKGITCGLSGSQSEEGITCGFSWEPIRGEHYVWL